MLSHSIATFGAGNIFGAALAASGVYSPYVIMSQMHFQDFHMLQSFLAASAVSALAMVAAKRLGIAQCKPRTNSRLLGWFNGYDGNVLGGVMLGLGMTLTGACPGTVLVQVSTGIRSGYLALVGGLFGGFLYTKIGHLLRAPAKTTSTEEPGQKSETPQTIHRYFSMKESSAVLWFEAITLITISSAALVTPGGTNVMVHPIVGGLLIGGAQAASLILTGNAVGVSTAYEQISNITGHILSSIFGSKQERNLPSYGSIPFAAGIITGSYVLLSAIPASVPGGEVTISMGKALLGGTLMVFGARLAGGCTSGHGISGLSTLSMSSLITVASIFAGGMGLAALI